MNKLEQNLGGPPASIRYLDADYQVIKPGTHVICAVTGEPIILRNLRYWSVDRQEPYRDAKASLERTLQLANEEAS